MRRIINLGLIFILVITLSSCGENVDSIGGLMSLGVYDSKLYYIKSEYALEIDNGIYEITNDGYDLAYNLTANQVGVSIIDGKFFVREEVYLESGRYPDYYKYFLIDIDTLEITEIPVITQDKNGLVYYSNYMSEDDCILFSGSINSTFYIYDISSETYIHEYTLTIVDWPVSTSFYIDGMLYMRNDYHDYSYVYSFETEVLTDVYDTQSSSSSGYFNSHPVYRYIDGTNIFLFDALNINYGLRAYDIIKSDSNYDEVDIFEVPQFSYYDFSGTNFFVYDKNSYDGDVSVSIYDLDFNLERTIDIDATCEHVEIINDEMIECSAREDRGALLQTHYLKIEIYSLITGDKLYDSGWVKISSQAKAINKYKKD